MAEISMYKSHDNITGDGHGAVARNIQTSDGHRVWFSRQRRGMFVDLVRASHFSEVPVGDFPVSCFEFQNVI